MIKKIAIITTILSLAAVLLIIIFTDYTLITAKPNGSAPVPEFLNRGKNTKDLPLGCGAKDCMECHSLSKQDASGMLQKLNAGHIKVMDIQMSPVRGLWEVSVDDKGQRGVLYIDFSKNYIISGSIIAVDQRIDITRQRMDELQRNRKIDVSKIPLHDAIVMGNPNAAKKVVMFTDPG